ncbi:MAG TPA: hypothetical protein VFN95_09820, partial [Flavitalea sp.]|nr:hypothetical protein [Flavitalea sp.]
SLLSCRGLTHLKDSAFIRYCFSYLQAPCEIPVTCHYIEAHARLLRTAKDYRGISEGAEGQQNVPTDHVDVRASERLSTHSVIVSATVIVGCSIKVFVT